MNRRSLLAGALLASPLARRLPSQRAELLADARSEAALRLRQRAALIQSKRPVATSVANGDETNIPDWIGCYSKGLPQNQFGEVEPAAYRTLLAAMRSGKYADFERIPLGAGRKLLNPQAAFAFHLEGADPHCFAIPPAPSMTSQEAAMETSELYWQALCRDVPFSDYESSPLIRQAADHLRVTPATIFRAPLKGVLEGPYISQFFLKPIPYGSGHIDQRYPVPLPGSDFMTSVSEWTQIQSGMPPWREVPYDATQRFLRTGRDLAKCVHYDFPYQVYLNAALILLNTGPNTILSANPFRCLSNPYGNSRLPVVSSRPDEGFVTFGQAEVTDWVARVTTAALKACWCQKWMVHRRVRPEALGGLIHYTKTGVRSYRVAPALLESPAVEAIFARTGTYLFPQVYPEGCPLHPSYPAAHSAVSGACSVMLKAFFNEDMLLPGCVVPSSDGLSLLTCKGYAPTVGDEVNKLAFNIAFARNWAGVHYRSDDMAGLRLGEDVAISILQDLVCTYTEDFAGFSFTRMDGTKVRITPQAEVIFG